MRAVKCLKIRSTEAACVCSRGNTKWESSIPWTDNFAQLTAPRCFPPSRRCPCPARELARVSQPPALLQQALVLAVSWPGPGSQFWQIPDCLSQSARILLELHLGERHSPTKTLRPQQICSTRQTAHCSPAFNPQMRSLGR